LAITIYAGKEADKQPRIPEVILRLAIIKKMVEMHNGQLDVNPSPHFGSRSVCSIPFALPPG
jgi:signal transduction histidine kinase